VMVAGAEKARTIAAQTLDTVKTKMGFLHA
jgi:hypothetical protein